MKLEIKTIWEREFGFVKEKLKMGLEKRKKLSYGREGERELECVNRILKWSGRRERRRRFCSGTDLTLQLVNFLLSHMKHRDVIC
jgi:hypothetical protein